MSGNVIPHTDNGRAGPPLHIHIDLDCTRGEHRLVGACPARPVNSTQRIQRRRPNDSDHEKRMSSIPCRTIYFRTPQAGGQARPYRYVRRGCVSGNIFPHTNGGQVVESTQSAVASLGFLEILDIRPATKSKISG